MEISATKVMQKTVDVKDDELCHGSSGNVVDLEFAEVFGIETQALASGQELAIGMISTPDKAILGQDIQGSYLMDQPVTNGKTKAAADQEADQIVADIQVQMIPETEMQMAAPNIGADQAIAEPAASLRTDAAATEMMITDPLQACTDEWQAATAHKSPAQADALQMNEVQASAAQTNATREATTQAATAQAATAQPVTAQQAVAAQAATAQAATAQAATAQPATAKPATAQADMAHTENRLPMQIGIRQVRSMLDELVNETSTQSEEGRKLHTGDVGGSAERMGLEPVLPPNRRQDAGGMHFMDISDRTPVYDQIVKRIAQLPPKDELLGGSALQIDLKPEFLGKIKITLEMNNGTLKAVITAQSADIRDSIAGTISSLQEAFRQKGIDVASLDVRCDGGFNEASHRHWTGTGEGRGSGDGAGQRYNGYMADSLPHIGNVELKYQWGGSSGILDCFA